MPIFLRIIIQRVLVVTVTFLAFLGVDVDIAIPSIEEQEQTKVIQREAVKEILSPKPSESSIPVDRDVREIINQVRDNQENFREGVKKKIGIDQGLDGDTKPSLNNVLSEATSFGPETNNFIENVVVNIVCVNRISNRIRLTTGSGVVISPSGIVLTNAHVANSFLFNDKTSEDYQECTLRRENIPTYGFNADLVYISNDWINQNLDFFTARNPKGTGEEDYALLAITSNTNQALSLPDNFEYAPLLTSDSNIKEGVKVVAAGYPGTSSGIFEIDSNSSLKIAETFVDEVFTFETYSVDIVSTGPNNVAQKGASGGGVFDGNDLLGITVTTDNTGEGSFINAITSPYILRDFNKDTGKKLTDFININTDILVQEFKNNQHDYLRSVIYGAF